MVFGDIIKAVYNLKHGEYERTIDNPIPKRIIIFVDD
jgi:hypothetical protein